MPVTKLQIDRKISGRQAVLDFPAFENMKGTNRREQRAVPADRMNNPSYHLFSKQPMVESLAGRPEFYKARFNILVIRGRVTALRVVQDEGKIWRRGWDSNPSLLFIARKL